MLLCMRFRGTAEWVGSHVLHRVLPLIFPEPTRSMTYIKSVPVFTALVF